MWPHPEAFAAALLLHNATGDPRYMALAESVQYLNPHLSL
jgi:hypothetical protein